MGSAIKKYGFSIEASRHIKTENILEKYLCHANDIFLTTRDVTQDAELLGSPGIIPPCIKQKVVLGSNLYKLEMKNKKLPISVIYFLLRSDLYREYVKEVASGTSILMLKKSDLDSFSFKVPPTSMLVKLDEILSNILSKLNVNFQQEITVKKIRDNLLPKLMSGEVRLN
jgi:type I restriction enzyme S subunit